MDNLNLTVEEYIMLEEKKARKHEKVFNWQTAIYGKIRVDDDFYDLRSMEAEFHLQSVVDDLDFFKGFENEFPAIIYNDAQMSKPDLLTKSILNPQHIDEFDLSDETSLSEYDEEEQNVLYFNVLFPFNIIHSDDLKSKKDKDDNDIDITQPLLDNEIAHGSTMLFETSHDKYRRFKFLYSCAFLVDFANMALPPREQRHQFLRYEGLEYTDSDIADFESRLERIYSREIYRVHVVDLQGMPEPFRGGLFARMAMEHRDEAGVVVFTSQAWRGLFDTMGLLVWELILEFLSTLRFREVLLDLDAPGTMQFQLSGARRRLSWRQFILALGLHTGEEMEFIGFAMMFTAGRKSGAHISGGQFVARLVEHFGLLTDEILKGLMIIAPELQIIDMAGGRCRFDAVEILGPPGMARLKEDMHEICGALTEQREVIDVMACDFSRFSTWVVTGLGRMMDRAGVTYTPYSQTHVP
ncbi:hypothetical protein Tco_0099236 [Tanacetum coccineum]